MIGGEILDSITSDIDKNYQNDDWNALQFSCSLNEAEVVKSLISDGANTNYQNNNLAIPKICSLHIACRYGYLDIIKLLIPHCDINKQDQWGFTGLHYATVARHKEVILYLLANGASAIVKSKNDCTALDLAQQLNFDDITDAMKSKSNLESDPTVPIFKEWMIYLGAGEYATKFIEAGYDLPFIAKHGLADKDLDCIGIPNNKMGLRRKIIQLHELNKFYEPETVDNDEDEEDEDEEEENEDEEDDD